MTYDPLVHWYKYNEPARPSVVNHSLPSSMSSASSRSDSIASAHVDLDEQGSLRLYHIYKKPFRRHYEVKSTDDQSLYYGEVSSLTLNKPDVTLHAGMSAKDPVVAVSKFMKLSGDYKLGLGNPEEVSHVQWEDMTKESALHSKYRLEMTVSSQLGDPHEERRSFLWKRTRHVKVDDATPPLWSVRNYKLVDERTGELLAVFARERSLSKCGTLQIKAQFGETFDTMAIISCMSLYEKARRRNRSAGGGGGGG